ncbi:MAG: iron uptake porin [Candidatus Sericytochromatia bacterium]|nr:iron uptake porin [Candidatus Sericytochromatia bacterium]
MPRPPLAYPLLASLALGAAGGALPAQAATPVAELRDVGPDHWAYQAIQALVERYGVMEGFPDKKFHGSRLVSRNQLAAALAKLLATVEKRIAIATGQPLPEPGISPEDLRTIARLQREFREELDALKERQDSLEGRLAGLEKRVRLGGELRFDHRDWLADPRGTLTGAPAGDVRVRQALTLEAPLPRGLTFTGVLNADLYAPSPAGNAFLRGVGATPVMDVYLAEALLRSAEGQRQAAAGLGALRDHLPLGASGPDPFRAPTWTNGTGGFGFVGTPGLAFDPTGALTAATTAVGAPVWLAGTSPTADWVDPANSSLYAPHGSLLAAGHGLIGPVRLGLGLSRGVLSGPLMQGGTPLTAASLPGLPTWADGTRATATAGAELGPLSVSAVASGGSDRGLEPAARNKLLGASFDLGDEALSLAGEFLAFGSLTPGDWSPGRASLRLGSSDLLGLGLGAHVGWLAGQVAPLTPGASGTPEFTRRAVAGHWSEFDSLGLVLRTPALFILPSVTLAFQQTGLGGGPTAALSRATASGFTLQTDLSLFNWPQVTASWSRGKFGTGPQGLLDAAPFTHDQLAISTGVKF